MKATPTKLRSPLKWHGGKSYLARRIIALFPPHTTYVEPFAGGLNVLLNKPESHTEVVGDLNSDLIRFWKTIQRNPSDVIRHLRQMVYSADTFERAAYWAAREIHDNSAHAAWFMARNRMSRGGLGKSFAWSDRLRGKARPGGPIPGDLNAWKTAIEGLDDVTRRIRRVKFYNANALELIEGFDHRDTLIYCDPPYLHSTRKAKAAYEHEMSEADHKELLSALVCCESKVFLSGYRSALYDSMLEGWTRHEFDLPNHSGQGKTKQRRIECVWESPSRT